LILRPPIARPDSPADPTREGAFDLLSAVLDQRVALEVALDALPPMEARDRAAAHRLVACVLRRLGTIDAVLEPLLQRAPPPRLMHILRLGVAGLLLLNTPAHAAVGTAVALTRRRGHAGLAGFVNAVLRRVASDGPGVLEQLDGPRLDTPAWLWSAWGEHARAIATAHAQEAPLDLTLAPGASAPVGGERLPTGSWRYVAGTDVTGLAGYTAGWFWVQDAAAALPARLLAARPGERVADLCAAPGGKTAQMAAAGADVLAIDRDSARLARVGENLARLRLSARLRVADAPETLDEDGFDAVLLDAPCTGLGTVRRHPDILRLKRPRDVAKQAALQDRLLDSAVRLLRPGGRLIYAVCSLQQEEGSARIAGALARLPLQLAPFRPEELTDLPEALRAEGWLQTHPGLWPALGGMDGFFAARLIRCG
jgi:16S rRNA (cytosine967-C5)-methyltransferase